MGPRPENMRRRRRSGSSGTWMAAVLFLVVVHNGLTLLSVPLSGWFLFKGAAFLLAVVLDVARSRTRLAG